jgi:hypothetical protein
MRHFLLALCLLGCSEPSEGSPRLDATVDNGMIQDNGVDGGIDAG